jgi:Arc/MetJ-type ribon-helix-helix transcriptional regulator
MQVTLSSETEEIIAQKVRSGVFANAEEAVAACVMLLDHSSDDAINARRRAIVESLDRASQDIEAGRGSAFEVHAFLARARALRQVKADL